MGPSPLTPRAILDVLDDAAAGFAFPMLDNGYVYPVDIRLSAYGDGARWAIVFEWMGVDNRALEFHNSLYCYGNCLIPQRSEKDFVSPAAYQTWRARNAFQETVFLGPVDDGPSAPLLGEDTGLEVNPAATDLRIRERVVPIPRDPTLYRARGIRLRHPLRIELYELMRYLLPDHRDLLVASEQEIHQIVPPDLPRLLRLDEWRHPDLVEDQRPSALKTFRMIAQVLVTGDPSEYEPPRRANTHWSNWPEGGTL